MITIAYLLEKYLNYSETFIWQYLNHLSNVKPIVFCKDIQNIDQFFLKNGDVIRFGAPRYSFSWWINQLHKRILGVPNGAIRRSIRKKNVKLLHAHFGMNGAAYIDVVESLDLPLITSFYGADASNRNVIERYRENYKKLFKYGSIFLTEGPTLKQKLIELGCQSRKIHIQHIAIDVEKYPFRIRSWKTSKKINLLFVGRIIEKKGLGYALEAFIKVVKKYPIQFRIIGDGLLKKELQNKCYELGIEKDVTWLGILPHKEVIRELDLSDILIHPSITARNGDSEGGAPTIILEAQACGVPILATTHADIPYVTVEGKSALLSPEKDVKILVDNLDFLLSNPNIWKNMGKTGHDFVEENHNILKEVINLENIYSELL